MVKCPNCGAELPDGQKFCGECGTPIPQKKKCPKCSASMPMTMKFCTECGFFFNGGVAKDAPKPASAQTPKKSVTVAQDGTGDVKSISNALKLVAERGTITVKNGEYHESLKIDKEIVLRGESSGRDIPLISCIGDSYSLKITASATLENIGVSSGGYGVLISGKCNPKITACDIHNCEKEAVVIQNGASPLIKSCDVHDNKKHGICLTEESCARIENCNLFENGGVAVDVNEECRADVLNCSIRDSALNGIRYDNSTGTVSECDIYGCESSAIILKNGAAAEIKACKIHDNQHFGVNVKGCKKVKIEDCEFFNNKEKNIGVDYYSEPTILNCKETENKHVSTPTSSIGEGSEDENIFIDPRDGQKYKTVKIGDQIWMAENLRYKAHNESFYAAHIKALEKSFGLSLSHITSYGFLYDGYSAQTIAPEGWHLPSKEEFETLINYVGGADDAGTALKAMSSDWRDDTSRGKKAIPGTDEVGFSALPAGYSFWDQDTDKDSIDQVGLSAGFWSSTMFDRDGRDCAYYMGVYSFLSEAILESFGVIYGLFSVRCIKD